MLPARPTARPRPCPVCGRDVDALRAPRVCWLDGGVRFLCSEACLLRFLDGEQAFDTAVRPPSPSTRAERPSIPDLVREATLVREPSAAADGTDREAHQYESAAAAGLALVSLGLVLVSSQPALGWLAALLLGLSAALDARVPLRTIRTPESLRAVAPCGLVLAAAAAAAIVDPEARRWALLGASAAGLGIAGRNWIHAAMVLPVRTVADELRGTLPGKARIPSRGQSAYEEVPFTRLHPGDLAVVLEGELVPADGVVEEGAGLALRHPRAAHSKPYAKGDFILAGTRVLEGALTVRVRRTGAERSIARALGLTKRKQPVRVALRLRFALLHWSWLLVALAAVATLMWAGPSAAATLLLGLPVLAIVASLDGPPEAAALASARRGIFFGSVRALRDAGRISTCAILLRGALTAGEPIVQQVYRLGSQDPPWIIGLAAAAEKTAEEHPIARAIRRYASEHDYPAATVRKERALAGLGVTAVTAHGIPIVVGRRQLLLDEGISVATADSDAAHMENEGLTPIFVAMDGRVEILLAILDPTHVGARDAVQRIADLPCEVLILSGDDRRTVERIAAQLGVTRVKAPLLPHERVAEVRALRETGGITAAIGRGGEDDAVLAASDLPVSLRLMGTALEERGVVIASRDVRDAADSLWIARAARRSIWRSIGACVVVGLLVAVGAGLDWMTPMAATFIALGTEAWALRAGSRLLRRVDLRVPMQQ
jgi:Cu+-exporting ATPase